MQRALVCLPLFNKAASLEDTVASVLKQRVPDHWELHIAIVDDGSTDGSPAVAARLAGSSPRITLILQQHNLGRSTACNTAARSSVSDFLIFLDCDCVWDRDDVFGKFVRYFESQARVCIGIISGFESCSGEFWSRYYTELMNLRLCSSIGYTEFTTANFGIDTALFQELNGFPSEYTQYGFEDRDFLLSLASKLEDKEEPIVATNIVASNRDIPDILTVYNKMRASGRHSANIFRTRHPAHYYRMSYSVADFSCMPTVKKIIGILLLPMCLLLCRVALINFPLPIVGYQANKAILRFVSAVAFFSGTLKGRYASNVRKSNLL